MSTIDSPRSVGAIVCSALLVASGVGGIFVGADITNWGGAAPIGIIVAALTTLIGLGISRS